jgi:hypothetical protein
MITVNILQEVLYTINSKITINILQEVLYTINSKITVNILQEVLYTINSKITVNILQEVLYTINSKITVNQGSRWASPMSPFAIFNFNWRQNMALGDNIFIIKNYLDSIKGN